MVAPELRIPNAESDLFQAIFRVSPGAMAISKLDNGRFIEVNDQMTRLYGYSRDEMLGRTSVELGIWADASEREKLVTVLRRDGKVRDLELHLRARDGTERVVLSSIDVVSYGGQEWMLSSNLDITERKRMEKALVEANAYREAVLGAQSELGLGIAALEGGRLVDANDAYQRVTGRSLDELRALADLTTLVVPEDRAAATDRLRRRSAEDFSDRRFEARLLRPDGTIAHADIAAMPFRHGGVTRTLLLTRDVSARKAAEAALEAARAELEKKERLAGLGMLVMGVAHEVNNPLQILRMNVEIAKRRAEKEGHADLVKLHERDLLAIDRLARVGRGLQTLVATESRIGARGAADANEIARAALDALAGAPGVERVHAALHATARVDADEAAIADVVETLVQNAIDATASAKGAAIALRTRDATAHVIIEVEDHGAGIPKDAIPRVFSPFFSTKHDGLGLALATAYRIVKDHGGDLTLESEPGRTVFRVRLPRSS